MGVNRLYAFLHEHPLTRRAFLDGKPGSSEETCDVNHVYVDFNMCVHGAMEESGGTSSESRLVENVLKHVDRILAPFLTSNDQSASSAPPDQQENPRVVSSGRPRQGAALKSVYIALDGPAGRARIDKQRSNNQHKEDEWKLGLKPGTRLTKLLVEALRERVGKYAAAGKKFNIQICDAAGEGEHKILRRLWQNHRSAPGRHCIIGTDSDLFLMVIGLTRTFEGSLGRGAVTKSSDFFPEDVLVWYRPLTQQFDPKFAHIKNCVFVRRRFVQQLQRALLGSSFRGSSASAPHDRPSAGGGELMSCSWSEREDVVCTDLVVLALLAGDDYLPALLLDTGPAIDEYLRIAEQRRSLPVADWQIVQRCAIAVGTTRVVERFRFAKNDTLQRCIRATCCETIDGDGSSRCEDDFLLDEIGNFLHNPGSDEDFMRVATGTLPDSVGDVPDNQVFQAVLALPADRKKDIARHLLYTQGENLIPLPANADVDNTKSFLRGLLWILECIKCEGFSLSEHHSPGLKHRLRRLFNKVHMDQVIDFLMHTGQMEALRGPMAPNLHDIEQRLAEASREIPVISADEAGGTSKTTSAVLQIPELDTFLKAQALSPLTCLVACMPRNKLDVVMSSRVNAFVSLVFARGGLMRTSSVSDGEGSGGATIGDPTDDRDPFRMIAAMLHGVCLRDATEKLVPLREQSDNTLRALNQRKADVARIDFEKLGQQAEAEARFDTAFPLLVRAQRNARAAAQRLWNESSRFADIGDVDLLELDRLFRLAAAEGPAGVEVADALRVRV